MVKNLPAKAGGSRSLGSVPELGRSPGIGKSNPLQYSCLGNPMGRGAWQTTVHAIEKSWTQVHSLRLTLCSCPTSRFNSTIKLELLFLTHFAESERLVLKHELYRISVCTFLIIFLKLSEPWFLYLQNDSANNSYFIRLLKEKMAKVTEHLV